MDSPEPENRPAVLDKVRFLSDPASYPHAPASVEVVETHMSWVFLAGEQVFKLKKPVRYDFLDFRTLPRRRKAVRDEVRLNRRLAPDVYRAPCPLTMDAKGQMSLNGAGQVVDWLVPMRRLPEDRNLGAMAETGSLTPQHVRAVARRLAEFYRALPVERVEATTYLAGFEAGHAKTRAVLLDPALALDGSRLHRILKDFEDSLSALRPALCDRVEQGHIAEGHGDLRPQHVFVNDPPVIIDCLEFNRGLRLVDPFDEIAFLGMEAALLGADWVFALLVQHLTEALHDRPAPGVLAFYWRYRALLRARLTLLHLADKAPRTPEKWRPLTWRYIALAEAADVMTRLPEDP